MKGLLAHLSAEHKTEPTVLAHLPTQPAAVVLKMEAQLEYVHVARTFLPRLAPICMPSRCFIDKISASEAQAEVY